VYLIDILQQVEFGTLVLPSNEPSCLSMISIAPTAKLSNPTCCGRETDSELPQFLSEAMAMAIGDVYASPTVHIVVPGPFLCPGPVRRRGTFGNYISAASQRDTDWEIYERGWENHHIPVRTRQWRAGSSVRTKFPRKWDNLP